MEEGNVFETNSITAAAFVEGGIQEACDDACSICLEAFCETDPSTVTSCKHEFHLQCILEWCQRSSQCPMCWQSISLKDPTSQELLDAVETERNMRTNPHRQSAVFHYPAIGDFELQHLPVSDIELEERILQHLAAAAAMGRARQLARTDGQTRSQPSTQNGAQDSSQLVARPLSPEANQLMTSSSGSSGAPNGDETSSSNRAGPSDFQSFSDTLKSRFTALSTRYKESITKSTRGWKDRLFARNSSTPEPSVEARGVVNQDIANVSQMVEHLEIAEEGSRTNTSTLTNNPENSSTQIPIEGLQTVDVGPSPSLSEDNIRIASNP